MSWIAQLSDQRQRQLEKEEIIDSRLNYECKTQCPETLQNYFFNVRRLNRLASDKLYKSSFYSYPSLLVQHMDMFDRIHEDLLSTSSTESLCSTLKPTNQKILDEINKYLA
jgi:hypothetical protein